MRTIEIDFGRWTVLDRPPSQDPNTPKTLIEIDVGDNWIEVGIVPASAFDYNAKFSRNDLYCGDITGIVGNGGTLAVFQCVM